MRIELFRGSLLDVPAVDVLVFPANKQLSLGWGSHLAEEIQRRAQGPVEEEALRWAEEHLGAMPGKGIALGEASVSSAAGLNARHLVHAAVLDKYDFNPLFLLKLRQRTSDQTLRLAVQSALARSRELGAESMALSLMGAGLGGMPTRKCIRITLQELRAPAKALRRVVIAVLEPGDAAIVDEELRAAQARPGST